MLKKQLLSDSEPFQGLTDTGQRAYIMRTMREIAALAALSLSLLPLGCAKKEKPAGEKPVGRGIIADPLKSKPMLEKARLAQSQADKTGKALETELNKIE
jgi:hypothetical protein